MELSNILEEELIRIYNSMDRRYGYNMIAGGNNKKRRQEVTDKIAEKNRHPSEETRRKMSIASTGRKASPEKIEKIRKSNLGKKRSEETRRRISLSKQNISDETRRKIGEASKGRKRSEHAIEITRQVMKGNRFRAVPVAQYDLNGNFIRVWECAMDAEKEYKIDNLHSGIASVCRGNSKQSGGFQWRYYKGNNTNIEPMVNKHYKPVGQFDNDWKFIKKYNSITEAAMEINNSKSTHKISKCCNGKIETAYGFKWKYL